MRIRSRGLSLLEVSVAMAVFAVAAVAAIHAAMIYVRGERLAEERRLALQAATEKVEEIRRYVKNGHSLDEVFDQYGPLPSPVGAPGAKFLVRGLETDSPNAALRQWVGTVSLIIDETPNEQDYCYDYSRDPPVLLGADINGNRYYRDSYPATPPSPFPLDLNGDGDTTDNPMTEGFFILPVVVTVHWNSVYGPERIDLFTIIFPDWKQ